MIAYRIITLVLCLLLIAGCGGGRLIVNVKSTAHLTANNYFAIDIGSAKVDAGYSSSKGDNLGIKEKLEQRLISSGFNVVEKSLIPQGESSTNCYLIQCNYWGNHKTFRGGWVFITFSASVSNLKTGEVVATADFTGSGPIGEVLDDFVNQLSPLAKPNK